MRRRCYYFGRFEVPLPAGGVALVSCTACGLLYKNVVPERTAFVEIMSAAAADVWRPKKGIHPAISMLAPILGGRRMDVLDVGASNGDLLAQLKPWTRRSSALDVAVFRQCREVVDGEYIVGDVDGPIEWSRQPYDLVTAFDVFEHFVDARKALENISSMVSPGGFLVIETGDWTACPGDLGDWYYCNLFEHHVFWSHASFEFACARHGLQIERYDLVDHKGRRALGPVKNMALRAATALAPSGTFARMMIALADRDPGLLGPPGLRDHAFVVMRRLHA